MRKEEGAYPSTLRRLTPDCPHNWPLIRVCDVLLGIRATLSERAALREELDKLSALVCPREGKRQELSVNTYVARSLANTSDIIERR